MSDEREFVDEASAVVPLSRLEAAELRATQIEVERNESEGREATLKGLLDRAWHRERKLREALQQTKGCLREERIEAIVDAALAEEDPRT